MRRYLITIILLTSLNLSANEQIFRMIPKEYNFLSSVNFEEIFKKEMPFLLEMAENADNDKFLERFKKCGLSPKLLKRLYFASQEDLFNAQQGDWNWLTFVEFTDDINLEKILEIMKPEFKLDILQGEIDGRKSFEINNEMQDIFLIQLNSRLIVLGSKASLQKSQTISKMGKEKGLQHSVLSNKKLMDLVATAQKHQIWITAEIINIEKLLNLTDFIISFDFDNDLKIGGILNFAKEESCNQVYTFWPMLKRGMMGDPLLLQNKHFYDTKFDRSIVFKITMPKAALKRAGMIKEKKKGEEKDVKSPKKGKIEESPDKETE